MTRPFELPTAYLITPEPAAGRPPGDFYLALERALDAGVRLVQLRVKTWDEDAYRALALQVLACCRRHGARLLLNAEPALAQALQADGVHLGSARLMACRTRPLPHGMLVSAACHNALQLQQANLIAADLLTLSPVLPTASHPDAEPLGWRRFGELAALTEIPVYALGGMTPQTLAEARAAGAHGIAAIRSLWGSTAGGAADIAGAPAV